MKFFYPFSITIISLTIILFIASLYLYFIPLKPIEFFSPYPVKTPVVKQGDFLRYTGNYCRNTILPAAASRVLVDKDGLVFPLLSTVGSTTKKGCDKLDIAILIPESIPPNTYIMKITATINMNFLRIFTASSTTNEFEVIAK